MSPHSRNVYFNAPAMIHADITRYPGSFDEDDPENKKNQDRALVIARKGWLTPDLMFNLDWNINETEKPTDDDGDQAGASPADQVVNVESLFPPKRQYGFRFMYNPPSIAFSLGIPEGVNPQFIMSGAEKATPQVPTGSTITLNLTISRVEDIAFIYGTNGHSPRSDLENVLKDYGYWELPVPGFPHKNIVRGDAPSYADTENTSNMLYNVRAETRAVLAQVREISRLGTMHDMNYLFRTLIARDVKTTYRGITSDIGIGFSVPMVLNLGNDNMMYRVKLGSLGYTHVQFHPSMIPTITTVSLSLERIPDAIEWTGTGARPSINRG